MHFKNKKAILFDLDGTLIDSAPDLANSINYMLRELQQDTFDEKQIRSWVGNGAKTLVKRALLANKKSDDKIAQDGLEIFLDHYKNNLCNKTVLYPSVKKRLKELKDRGFMLAIITNKPYDFISPILKKLEIDNYFEDFIGGDSLKFKKPDPTPLLFMCDKLKVPIDQAIMIGDSKNDILAARAASMSNIALSYGYNYNEDLNIYEPDLILDNFGKIADYLT